MKIAVHSCSSLLFSILILLPNSERLINKKSDLFHIRANLAQQYNKPLQQFDLFYFCLMKNTDAWHLNKLFSLTETGQSLHHLPLVSAILGNVFQLDCVVSHTIVYTNREPHVHAGCA